MYKNVNVEECLTIVYQRLSKGGVFLTVKGTTGESVPNTMTIGWGGITHYWGRPIFIVPVRKSRYTYDLIEEAGEFTVSVPIEASMRKALAFCGTNSGRDVDKCTAMRLTMIPGQRIKTPIIDQCDLHFECKVLLKQPMDAKLMAQEIEQKYYPDYHTMYYGEIVACYRKIQ